jgi:hypothetical protein
MQAYNEICKAKQTSAERIENCPSSPQAAAPWALLQELTSAIKDLNVDRSGYATSVTVEYPTESR